jgi:phage shock protein A
MSYFSRLTDIVTCNLTKLLEEAEDPRAALQQIIEEMEEGVSGARRSMRTAESNEQRLRDELDEHRGQVAYWADKAREELKGGDEDQARLALVRKREAENLIAGLGQQLEAAISTREHLATTFRALEARLAEAVRRRSSAACSSEASESPSPEAAVMTSEIDDELAALKRELGAS